MIAHRELRRDRPRLHQRPQPRGHALELLQLGLGSPAVEQPIHVVRRLDQDVDRRRLSRARELREQLVERRSDGHERRRAALPQTDGTRFVAGANGEERGLLVAERGERDPTVAADRCVAVIGLAREPYRHGGRVRREVELLAVDGGPLAIAEKARVASGGFHAEAIEELRRGKGHGGSMPRRSHERIRALGSGG